VNCQIITICQIYVEINKIHLLTRTTNTLAFYIKTICKKTEYLNTVYIEYLF